MQEMYMVHLFMLCRKVKPDSDRREFLENSAKCKPMMSNEPSIVTVQTISNTYKQIWRISEVEQINRYKKEKKTNRPKASDETLIDLVTRNISLKTSFCRKKTSFTHTVKTLFLKHIPF